MRRPPGISKYRYRKNEAERRLNAAEDNLLRCGISCRNWRNGRAVKPRRKRRKNTSALAGEKKEVEIGLWLRTIEQSRDVLRDLSAKLELARTQYDAAGEAGGGDRGTHRRHRGGIPASDRPGWTR